MKKSVKMLMAAAVAMMAVTGCSSAKPAETTAAATTASAAETTTAQAAEATTAADADSFVIGIGQFQSMDPWIIVGTDFWKALQRKESWKVRI